MTFFTSDKCNLCFTYITKILRYFLSKKSKKFLYLFSVSALNTAANNESVFGKVNVLQPQASRQFLYCLAPQQSLTNDVRLLSGATNIGKLDMVWRSNLGERGRLQTSQLQRMVCLFYLFLFDCHFKVNVTSRW